MSCELLALLCAVQTSYVAVNTEYGTNKQINIRCDGEMSHINSRASWCVNQGLLPVASSVRQMGAVVFLNISAAGWSDSSQIW